jgi:GNAT superfamily N-acetyltransferase
MGLDTMLISDRTYFVVETVQDGKAVIVGCGGWSRRRTLYGGDHTAGRNDSYADPATDAARIRAMYTRPGWTRQGIGSLLLQLGENAARAAGYTTIELGATLSGEPALPGAGLRRGRPRDADGRQRLAQHRHRDAQTTLTRRAQLIRTVNRDAR